MARRTKGGGKGTVKEKVFQLLGVLPSSHADDDGALPPALLRAAEAKAGFVAIYIVAPRNQRWPISFGITTDPVATYHAFQKGWWEEHCLHVLLWAPSRKAADAVKRTMGDTLAPQRRFFSRSWYDASVDEAERVLQAAAAEARVFLFDDIEKQRKIYFSAQRAWEQKMGVQRELSSTSNVIPMPRGASNGKTEER